MPNDRRPLIFNLTRLASRQSSRTPTGVDRVDLRHARFVLERSNRVAVAFVHQQKDVLSLVPFDEARRLIDNLWERWVLSHPRPPLPTPRLARRFARWTNMKFRRRIDTLISSSIKQWLQGNPSPIYLNSGQVGVHHLHLHQRLIDELGAQLVFYLHDLIPIDYPEYARSLAGTETHRQRMVTMAKTGATIFTNSEYTQRRFKDYCTEQGLPIPEVRVLPIGIEEHFIMARRQPKNRIPEALAPRVYPPYFITVGTIEPRKNHLLLLHIWRQLAAELGHDCPLLVIVGRRGWENENILDLLDRSPAIRQYVVELTDLNDTDLITLLQNAKALLLPSFEEGWGIPVAEALTLGTPVLCSDIPALRECSQGAAILLDPLDSAAWREAIRTMASAHTTNTVTYTPHRWPEHLEGLASACAEPVP
ncbi:glycosyltransferase family 4 protein [Nitrococcus mobilis]|nr:glycosyltransferase family 1 protein [Nitrococcus mobilis]